MPLVRKPAEPASDIRRLKNTPKYPQSRLHPEGIIILHFSYVVTI